MANKMDNLEEMEKFLEKYSFPKRNQEEIENLKRPITSTEIEIVIRNLPANRSPPGSTVPGILQARTLEWVAISFSNPWTWKVKVKLLSHVRLFAVDYTCSLKKYILFFSFICKIFFVYTNGMCFKSLFYVLLLSSST